MEDDLKLIKDLRGRIEQSLLMLRPLLRRSSTKYKNGQVLSSVHEKVIIASKQLEDSVRELATQERVLVSEIRKQEEARRASGRVKPTNRERKS